VSPLSALEANISAAVAPLGSLVHNFSSYFSSTSPATTSPIIAMASTPSADSSIDSAVVLGGLPASSLAAPGNAGNVTSDPSTSAGASLTPLSIDHLLIPGDTGPQVVLLQKALAGQGFYNGPLNGKLGPATDAALVRFQVAYNIVAANARGSGQVGPKTRAVINQLLGQ
jgi:peptidoglycan hydrolase-like protein with peptidoglycan-binding domain